MGNMRRVKNRIQHDPKLAMKVNLVPLGVAMIGFQLFVAVPDKPNIEPEKIAGRIRTSMADMQDRACSQTVRDVYNQVGMIQQKRMEN